MLGILTGIVALIALGCIVVYAVKLTRTWLRNTIREKLKKKNTKQVLVADLEELIDECNNKVSLSDLEELKDDGYTHLMAEIDNKGQISGDIEIIRDTSKYIDDEVDEFINRTREGMVIVEG